MRTPVVQRTLVGTDVELVQQVAQLRATRGDVSAFQPRRLPDGTGWSVVVLVPRRTRQVSHRTAVITAAVPTALLMLAGVGWLLYLRTADAFALALKAGAVAAVVLVGVAAVWWMLGQAGRCPGLHCPGCRCGGAR